MRKHDYRFTRPNMVNYKELSGSQIAASLGCSKTVVNEFLRRFRSRGHSYLLEDGATSESLRNDLTARLGHSPGERMAAMSELVRETQSKLEYLGMGAMSHRLEELATSPEGLGLSPLALLEELVDAQYGLASTQLYERLSGKSGIPQGNYEMDRLRSDGKRMYPEEHMARLRTFEFMEPRTCHNIAVFGKSYAGKTYFLRAIGLEACRRDKSVLYVDFAMLVSDLKDRKAAGLRSFKRRLNLYARKDLLIIDDFLISPISEEAAHLVQVVNLREDIVAHGYYRISSGRVESVNNLIKTVRRQAYGYRDDDYFFLKIMDASRRMNTSGRESGKAMPA